MFLVFVIFLDLKTLENFLFYSVHGLCVEWEHAQAMIKSFNYSNVAQ